MTDGIKETSLFGKTSVTIKFDGTAEWAETAGFANIAEDIRKYYGISKGIQKHIDELAPRRDRSYDRDR